MSGTQIPFESDSIDKPFRSIGPWDAGYLTAALNNPGHASREWENLPPSMIFNYTYKHPFA